MADFDGIMKIISNVGTTVKAFEIDIEAIKSRVSSQRKWPVMASLNDREANRGNEQYRVTDLHLHDAALCRESDNSKL